MEEPPATTPGEHRPSTTATPRRLSEPPSTRYTRPDPAPSQETTPSGLPGALARAVVVASAGAIVLTVVGAILTSTAGLLFVAGVTGAAVGLVLSSAAGVGDAALTDGRPITRRRVAWLSVAISLAAVAGAGLATWAIGRAEGGVLGPIDYLFETFGPFIPGEAILAAIGAWWGASTGPVRR